MSAFEVDLQIVHHFSNGVYARQMTLPAGHFAVTHAHDYDHLSILASGRAVVETDGETVEYIAPACIEIKAGINHKVMALEDVVWFCIHATDETDESKIDEVLFGR